MPVLGAVVLPDDHSISECWNPHYHKSPFKSDLATIFKLWYAEQDYHENFLRPAPLCIFGGTQNSVYVSKEHASGTYAVCSKCKEVTSCSYDDEKGLGPRRCSKCGAKLCLNNYFQPVIGGASISENDLLDPSCDPAVTIAEACALAPKGISFHFLPSVIAILKEENLLRTGKFINDIKLTGGSTMPADSRSIRNRLQCFQTYWAYIDPCASRFNVKISKRGQVMLKARKIRPVRGAKEKVRNLLSFDESKLNVLILRTHANLLEKQAS